MEKDFVKELDYLGFTMRLKRISDAMMHEGRRLYKNLDTDIEPNWYVVFKLLKKEGTCTITSMADKLLMSHPSVITITNKMIKAGYLVSEQSKEDTRKRELMLSPKANKELPKLEKIWKAGEKGVQKVLEPINGLAFIEELEKHFFARGFKDRTLEQLNNQ